MQMMHKGTVVPGFSCHHYKGMLLESTQAQAAPVSLTSKALLRLLSLQQSACYPDLIF